MSCTGGVKPVGFVVGEMRTIAYRYNVTQFRDTALVEERL